ncbi:MAG: DivIVA domain-containing protein [Tenericutes bacterium]|nr:DivIVA domain-containing protein [Mycoplasmatota bacterium]MDY3801648.1 DivIVA domain-containing protein [Bacilli bacterium]
MYQDRILLSSKDILEHEFKFDTRGYRPQEVDKYLDVIIHDYEEFDRIIQDYENEKKELIEDNIRLKQEIRRLRTQMEALKDVAKEPNNNNADLLRRVSNLEKFIYGDK